MQRRIQRATAVSLFHTNVREVYAQLNRVIRTSSGTCCRHSELCNIQDIPNHLAGFVALKWANIDIFFNENPSIWPKESSNIIFNP